jgi:hypothetical protein
MTASRADELEQFKTKINLTEYAASVGYAIDRKGSSRNSVIMRDGSGDKVVIAIDSTDRHWVFFSVRDLSDNGSIIDFVQNRQGCSIGEVRKALRPWIGLASQPPARPPKDHYAEQVEPSSRETARVVAEYEQMPPLKRHHYLEQRGITPKLLQDARFTGKIRQDRRNNVVFPHFNADGLCGYELKNHHFTGFARGGNKGLWTSAANRADTRLVVTESAMDALSYHALHPDTHTRYLSIGGAMNPDQPVLIARAIQRLPQHGALVIATDNDPGGDMLADELRAIVEAAKRPDLTLTEDRPSDRGQDWNDTLKARRLLKSAAVNSRQR